MLLLRLLWCSSRFRLSLDDDDSLCVYIREKAQLLCCRDEAEVVALAEVWDIRASMRGLFGSMLSWRDYAGFRMCHVATVFRGYRVVCGVRRILLYWMENDGNLRFG